MLLDVSGRLIQNSEAPTLSAAPTVTVMPFEDLTGQSHAARLAKSVTYEVILQLAKQHGMNVIVPDVSDDEETQASSGPGDQGYLLQGSVRIGGNSMRLLVRLVTRETRAIVWSDSYDASIDASKPIDLETQLAQKVASAIVQFGGISRKEARL
ncbi:hypothetical protein [Sinorhizobium sp. BG8]|uniref:hypothetical protein n=1 Tax=Sinorhizobium sp. BG8 TaxID=2613773 RepID=UPI00193CB5DA|nr:hypothetical protein [Sinorhizobium sp. BG8]QRM54722.1 hypothetical protein F3Y30_09340 [Sinorhizobium sp. BG8]